jgi:hypothetical protein
MITSKDLAKLNSATRTLILGYLEKKNISLNSFAKSCGVHQNQLWLYLNVDKTGDHGKGLHSGTIQKIGEYMSKNP